MGMDTESRRTSRWSRSRWSRRGLLGCLAGLMLGGTLAGPMEARAGIFEGFPDVLLCDGGPVGMVAFYVSFREPNGSVTYRALVKAPVPIRVTPGGRVETDRKFCAGDTLEKLREAGRAFDLTGS